MDYNSAKEVFEQYLDGYDRENDKVRLKIVHTYGVVTQSMEIAREDAASVGRYRIGQNHCLAP